VTITSLLSTRSTGSGEAEESGNDDGRRSEDPDQRPSIRP
jgi:hypothetical protein